jgi:hypothetical protein
MGFLYCFFLFSKVETNIDLNFRNFRVCPSPLKSTTEHFEDKDSKIENKYISQQWWIGSSYILEYPTYSWFTPLLSPYVASFCSLLGAWRWHPYVIKIISYKHHNVIIICQLKAISNILSAERMETHFDAYDNEVGFTLQTIVMEGLFQFP